ncbi:MAG: multi-sensor signal transduction histidine [Planctomycetota bacterium]|nr:MAG: multi-sensor signal transduction histidine [Planctomycetota bacterium]
MNKFHVIDREGDRKPSPESCVPLLHLTPDDIARRKAYLGITAEDERLLREAHPLLAGSAEAVIERFYAYLLSQEHIRRMLEAPGLIDRLKALQRAYFQRLTAGDYGMEYFQDRLRVGDTHERVGLAPEWYIGAYQTYLQIVRDVLRQALPPGDDRLFPTISALSKIVTLDVGLAIDAYIERARGRLEQRNAELIRLQSAKQTLTDMIVHDLQNPLAGIRAFLEHFASRKDAVTAAEREALEEALRRCDDLGEMVMNVLQVSRAESGKLEVYLEELDLAELAKRSVAAFDLHAKQEGRPIRIEAASPVNVRSDQSLLKRIFYNLIRNALRHTPRGTKISICVTSSGEGRGEFVISDDGPGIPPDVQPLLFERFGASSLRAAGLRVDTGLGLAFCRSAVDALGGRIVVESDGTKGTAFRISIGRPEP